MSGYLTNSSPRNPASTLTERVQAAFAVVLGDHPELDAWCQRNPTAPERIVAQVAELYDHGRPEDLERAILTRLRTATMIGADRALAALGV